MAAPNRAHVLFQLIEIRVGAKNRTCGRVECLKQAVTKADCRLSMIASRKKRSASDVAQRCLRSEMRTEIPHIFHVGIALMIEEPNPKAGVNCALIWIVNWPSHLIQTESPQQFCLVRNLMINPN